MYFVNREPFRITYDPRKQKTWRRPLSNRLSQKSVPLITSRTPVSLHRKEMKVDLTKRTSEESHTRISAWHLSCYGF